MKYSTGGPGARCLYEMDGPASYLKAECPDRETAEWLRDFLNAGVTVADYWERSQTDGRLVAAIDALVLAVNGQTPVQQMQMSGRV